jgi:opacity protein-like surface antigen
MHYVRFALLGAALAGSLATVAAAADAPTSVTVKMVAENGSGENGTATLKQVADGTLVTIKLDGAPKDTPQPTHIHIGTCANINKAPEYPLANTVNGASQSTVKGVELADLLKGSYAINIHKSGTELGTYVSCGDIKAPSSM